MKFGTNFLKFNLYIFVSKCNCCIVTTVHVFVYEVSSNYLKCRYNFDHNSKIHVSVKYNKLKYEQDVNHHLNMNIILKQSLKYS